MCTTKQALGRIPGPTEGTHAYTSSTEFVPANSRPSCGAHISFQYRTHPHSTWELLTQEKHFLAPYWPWNSPAGGDPASPTGKSELAKLFLQWDVACGGLAILAWASFVYLVAQPSKGFLRDVVPKVLTDRVVGGPVAATTVLFMERDAAVLGWSAKGKED